MKWASEEKILFGSKSFSKNTGIGSQPEEPLLRRGFFFGMWDTKRDCGVPSFMIIRNPEKPSR